MHWSRTPLVLFALAIIFIVAVIQKLRSWARLRHIPGPFSAGLSKAWLFWHTVTHQLDRVMADAPTSYGEGPHFKFDFTGLIGAK